MAYRFQLTYDEFIDMIDLKNIPTTTIGYTLPPGVYEVIDIKFMLMSFFRKEVKIKITIDHFKLKSNLTTNKTIRFTKKCFFIQY